MNLHVTLIFLVFIIMSSANLLEVKYYSIKYCHINVQSVPLNTGFEIVHNSLYDVILFDNKNNSTFKLTLNYTSDKIISHSQDANISCYDALKNVAHINNNFDLTFTGLTNNKLLIRSYNLTECIINISNEFLGSGFTVKLFYRYNVSFSSNAFNDTSVFNLQLNYETKPKRYTDNLSVIKCDDILKNANYVENIFNLKINSSISRASCNIFIFLLVLALINKLL